MEFRLMGFMSASPVWPSSPSPSPSSPSSSSYVFIEMCRSDMSSLALNEAPRWYRTSSSMLVEAASSLEVELSSVERGNRTESLGSNRKQFAQSRSAVWKSGHFSWQVNCIKRLD
uniref:(northern house mosquito) hypothetical protein n=1 Tax=Culex pipiens TaxID=7175 RepID=A0A8D8IUX2_CULPI